MDNKSHWSGFSKMQDNNSIWSQTLSNNIRLKPNITGSEWADLYRIVPQGTSPEPGKWHTSRTPYLKEIIDTATDINTRKIVVMCASQMGKSEMLLNVIGFYIHQAPSPILMVQPNIDMAQYFSKERIDPMILSTKELKKCVTGAEENEEAKISRKSSYTILNKSFAGGFLSLVGSNSESGLSSRPIRILLMDEVDRYNIYKDGDPVKLAAQRTSNFYNSKIVMVSTPTFPDTKIHEHFKHSDQREYYLLCPYCGTELLLEWGMVEWKTFDNGKLDPDSIALNCPHCHNKLRDKGRINPEWLKQGRWKKTAESDIAGFHISALYSPWIPLITLVQDFINVKQENSKQGLKCFYNLSLGLPYDQYKINGELWHSLYNRCENFPDKIPDRALVQTAGVDVQRDRIECSVYAWGVGYECWLIDHYILKGDPKLPDVWLDLKKLLLSVFNNKTESGRPCRLVKTFIDSGDGYSTSEVYRFVASMGKNVNAIKGQSYLGQDIPFVDQPKNKEVGQHNIVFYILSVDAGKHLIMQNLLKKPDMPGYIHFPKGRAHIDPEFFMQLTAEVYNPDTGHWQKIRKRNEALDCAVYARAAIEAANINFSALSKAFNL